MIYNNILNENKQLEYKGYVSTCTIGRVDNKPKYLTSFRLGGFYTQTFGIKLYFSLPL